MKDTRNGKIKNTREGDGEIPRRQSECLSLKQKNRSGAGYTPG